MKPEPPAITHNPSTPCLAPKQYSSIGQLRSLHPSAQPLPSMLRSSVATSAVENIIHSPARGWGTHLRISRTRHFILPGTAKRRFSAIAFRPSFDVIDRAELPPLGSTHPFPTGFGIMTLKHFCRYGGRATNPSVGLHLSSIG
jgi:hypothetical protein